MPMTLEKIQGTEFIKNCHQLLKDHAPGAAFDGEPFLVPQRGEYRPGREYFAANCFYHTVFVLPDRIAIFTRDEGGMVPWVGDDNLHFPDPDYLVAIVPSEDVFFTKARSAFFDFEKDAANKQSLENSRQKAKSLNI